MNGKLLLVRQNFSKHSSISCLGIDIGDLVEMLKGHLANSNMRSPLKFFVIKFKFLIFIHKIYLF